MQRTRSALPPPAPIILRDGSTAWLRPGRPNDVDTLASLFDRASRESLWLRFFTSARRVDRRDLERMLDADGISRFTYLVTRGEGTQEHVLAVGNYVRLPRWDTAEVAFFVDDSLHGKGLGTLLLERLADHARQQGILTLVADVLPDNHQMLDVFRQSGLTPHIKWDQGTMRVELPATPSEVAVARAEARERVATAASLTPFFRPRAVAVIGTDTDPEGMAGMVLARLIHGGFQGPVYPVFPGVRAAASVRAVPSIHDVPDELDLAVIAVPAEQVLAVVDACARKGVHALLALSAGFADSGADGPARQEELAHKVRACGMRLIGPHSIGLLNTASAVRLNATISPTFPTPGHVAISSQSGTLGLAILDYAEQLGLGISMFVSVGNKADVSGNDLLQYWEDDPDTHAILLYLESFGNPRKFARIARRIARRKPILAVKSGRTGTAISATLSRITETAGLNWNDRAVNALFHQAGVIRADTLEELFEVATVLVHQPLPEGNRVAIVTNAGGSGRLCADACSTNGLLLPPLKAQTLQTLRDLLPATAALENPINVSAWASPQHYEHAVHYLLRDPEVDALIVLFIPVRAMDGDEVANAIRCGVTAARDESGKEKPVLTCFMASHGVPSVLSKAPNTSAAVARAIPSFRFPESSARALARAVTYVQWRRQPLGQIPDLSGLDGAAAHALVQQITQAHAPGWLHPEETFRLLSTAGISVSPCPSGSPTTTASATVAVYVVDDPNFGPVIGFGLGGPATSVLQNLSFRITPLTDADAREMIDAVRNLPLFQDYGIRSADLSAIEDLLLRVSWLVEQLPEIVEMRLHPISVFNPGLGLIVADASVSVRR